MTCSDKETEFNPPNIPSGLPIPGFGFPFAPIQSPSPNNQLPTEVIEDIAQLVDSLSLIFPSSIFKPNADLKMKTVLDAFANLMSQAAPFLSLYSFFTAALKLLTCILEVLCAIPNPAAMTKKVKKLFTECLPPFLALFPWAALPIMVLSILKSILSLLEYIFSTLELIIQSTLENLIQMGESLTLQDNQSSEIAAQKIAGLLCFLDNIFAIFVSLGAILDIIQSLAQLAGGDICGDDSDCCQPENCPDFIKLFPDGHIISIGQLIYHKEINGDVDSLIPGLSALLSLPPKRTERWQLVDLQTSDYPISSIIAPINGKIFWPEELNSISSSASIKKIPYLVDLKLTAKLSDLNPSLPNFSKTLIFKNVYVIHKPYIGYLNYKNENLLSNTGGTFSLLGGQVFEEDGITPYLISGQQAKLEDIIHYQPFLSSSGFPITDDALVIDVIATWKPNHEALVDYKLITIGCMPTVANERTAQNNIQNLGGTNSFLDKIFPLQLPNISLAQKCLNQNLTELRKNISIESVLKFKASADLCLQTLQTETENTLCSSIVAGFSSFTSTISLSTQVQLLGVPILVFIELHDRSNNNLLLFASDSCIPFLLSKLSVTSTLGKISYQKFENGQLVFSLTTTQIGQGEITAEFNKQKFITIIPGSDTETTKTEITIIDFSFIEKIANPKPERDTRDISES